MVKQKFVTVRLEEETLKLAEKLGFDSRSQFLRFAARFTLSCLARAQGMEDFSLPSQRVGRGNPRFKAAELNRQNGGRKSYRNAEERV